MLLMTASTIWGFFAPPHRPSQSVCWNSSASLSSIPRSAARHFSVTYSHFVYCRGSSWMFFVKYSKVCFTSFKLNVFFMLQQYAVTLLLSQVSIVGGRTSFFFSEQRKFSVEKISQKEECKADHPVNLPLGKYFDVFFWIKQAYISLYMA